MSALTAQVDIVVIGYNDAPHVADAVRSALAQGPGVREVIGVDDCSSDGSPEVLAALTADEPRLRVLRRSTNSGGCGTPRNEGLARSTAPYVMFLDSDDLLPPGALDALLKAAREHDAEVAAGLCVRRELPDGRETPWQPRLYERPALVEDPEDLPRLAQDTLCVNKLYRTAFLRAHGIRFPEGRFVYEDFVFGARVLAARPRVALVTEPVYVWQVRRTAERPSLSLDRSDVANWHARIEAHRQAVLTFEEAGEPGLVRAARATFLERGLRMYLRELPQRGEAYRREWWRLSRAYLAGFDAEDFAAAPGPGRIAGRVVLASTAPRDLERLRDLVSRPSRLLPPYAEDAEGRPVWARDLPGVGLGPLLRRPVRVLPVTVDAALRPHAAGGVLRLRVHDLYGRLARARPTGVQAEFTHRSSHRSVQRRTAALTPGPQPGTWTAELRVNLADLETGSWDLWLLLGFADGTTRRTTARAVRSRRLLRRTALPSRRHGFVLVQPYATHSGSLALRVAPGLRGATVVVRRKLARLVGTR